MKTRTRQVLDGSDVGLDDDVVVVTGTAFGRFQAQAVVHKRDWHTWPDQQKETLWLHIETALNQMIAKSASRN